MLPSVDIIVHLAAETGTAQSMYEISRYNKVNSQGTAILLDLLSKEKHKVDKIILSSSRAVYGEGTYNCEKCGIVYPPSRTLANLKSGKWEINCPKCYGKINVLATPEVAELNPSSIYAATKLAQEHLVRIACEALSVNYVILRLQNVYGAGQSLDNPYTGMLSIFSTRIRKGLSIPIFEDGLESRDFIYINDVTRVIRLSIENDDANDKIFNVGSGKPTSIFDVANMLVENLGGERKPEITGQYRLGDIRHCYADINYISNVLGFIPNISIEAGIEEFCRWVKSQPLLKDKLDFANATLKKHGLMGCFGSDRILKPN